MIAVACWKLSHPMSYAAHSTGISLHTSARSSVCIGYIYANHTKGPDTHACTFLLISAAVLSKSKQFLLERTCLRHITEHLLANPGAGAAAVSVHCPTFDDAVLLQCCFPIPGPSLPTSFRACLLQVRGFRFRIFRVRTRIHILDVLIMVPAASTCGH